MPSTPGVATQIPSSGGAVGPHLSPDGAWLVYSVWPMCTEEAAICKRPVTGGTETALTDGTYLDVGPSWSPDMTRVAFTRHEEYGQDGQIHLMNSDGTDLAPLTASGHNDCGAFWSPDGSTIVILRFDTTMQLLTIPSAGGSEQVLVERDLFTGVAWSPDSQWLAYVDDDMQELRRVSLDGSADLLIAQGASGPVSWSPDGAWIAFAHVEGLPSDPTYDVRKVRADGTEETPLACDLDPPVFCSFSPDGNWVLFGCTLESTFGLDEDDVYSYLAKVPACGCTPTPTPTATPTGWTATPTPTDTPTMTPTPTATATVTPTPKWSAVGWARADGTEPLLAQVLYGNLNAGGMAGLPGDAVPKMDHCLVHFHSDATWYTGLVVGNPQAGTAHTTVTAYGHDGALQGIASLEVPGRGKRSLFVSSPLLFGNTVTAGWVRVESDVAVIASLVYGNRIDGGIAALPSGESGSALVLPHFHSHGTWWTGLAMVNPDSVSPAQVTLTGWTSTGMPLGSEAITVPALSKVSNFVRDFGAIGRWGRGWLEMTSDLPIATFSVMHASDWDTGSVGLAGIEAQEKGRLRFLPHYDAGSSWWTLFSLANGAAVTQFTQLRAYDNDGNLSGALAIDLLPRFLLEEEVQDLF